MALRVASESAGRAAILAVLDDIREIMETEPDGRHAAIGYLRTTALVETVEGLVRSRLGRYQDLVIERR
ncbi:MAG TPA: hypothetical protein VIT68_04360 [Candidatus Gracilibacteria bacterium]